MGGDRRMIVQQIATGGDRNFGYVVADETSNQAALVDPSYDPDRLVEWAQRNRLMAVYALITHDHHDHTNGNARVRELSGAKIVMHRNAAGKADVRVSDGDTLYLGQLPIHVIHTPGHDPSHVCYYVDDAVFTGDTLFVGKVGGTDLADGAQQEYESLHSKLMSLPDDTRVFPGHDVGVKPESTIANERDTNPFLLQPSFEAFVDLKKNWAAYKREHGIV